MNFGRHRSLMKMHQQLNSQAMLERWYHLVSWSIFADKVERHFNEISGLAKELDWFENIYVERIDSHRTVQLSHGVHPTGGGPIVNSESGATLVVSQSVIGTVIVMFYPFCSKLHRMDKRYVIWGHFDGPRDISDLEIDDAISDFLTYCRVTSAIMRESGSDRAAVLRLEKRSRELEGASSSTLIGRSAVGVLLIGSILTAGALIRWISLGADDGQFLEPWIGLLTLATGWAAVQVQKRDDAISKSMVRDVAETLISTFQGQKTAEFQKFPTRDCADS